MYNYGIFKEDTVLGISLAWDHYSSWSGFSVGVGWDEEHPLRPWPQISFQKNHEGGFCISWFGLFLNYRNSIYPDF